MAADAPPLAAEELARLSLAEYGARVILEQLEKARKHEPATREGRDPEDLHKMRVATRRMRVAFAVFEEALADAGVTNLPVAEVKGVASALGDVRDVDVFVKWLDEQACGYPPESVEAKAMARLRAERLERGEAARARMIATLDGPAMQALGPELAVRLEAVAAPPFHVPGADVKKKERVGSAGKRLLERARRRLRQRGRRLFAPTAAELHAVRIAAKRFRYVCEFLRPAFESREAQIDAAIERATAVQDALGELHDADVAEAALLDDVVRVGYEGEARDAAAIAALVKAQRARREAALLRFREEWEHVPKRKWLKKRAASDAASDTQRTDNGDDTDQPDGASDADSDHDKRQPA
jgi:CHAD domain-containing protein